MKSVSSLLQLLKNKMIKKIPFKKKMLYSIILKCLVLWKMNRSVMLTFMTANAGITVDKQVAFTAKNV